MIHRRYAVNSGKTLSAVALPAQTTTENNKVYLLAATLTGAAAAPSMQIGWTSQNRLRLAWPAGATGYQLHSTASLVGPVWSAVPETPQNVGNQFVVEVAPTEAARFYRLMK